MVDHDMRGNALARHRRPCKMQTPPNKHSVRALACTIGDFAVSLFMALVVEDDSLQREALADVLKREGLEVIECTTAEAAELVLATTGLELRALVTDVHLDGEMSGIELAEYAKRKYPLMTSISSAGLNGFCWK